MQAKIIETKIGPHLTEYKLAAFEEIKSNFVKYVTVDQWGAECKSMRDVLTQRWSFPIQVRQFPEQPANGRVLYGVNPDETLTFLWSVLDSSD
jgi:hypothetical protein